MAKVIFYFSMQVPLFCMERQLNQAIKKAFY